MWINILIVVSLFIIIILLYKLVYKSRYKYLECHSVLVDPSQPLVKYTVTYSDIYKEGVQTDVITGNFSNPRWIAQRHIESKNEAWRNECIRNFFNKSLK